MRLQELHGLMHAAPAPSDPERELRAAADDLLREFLALTNWEHPAAERYRKARAAVEDFSE